MKGIIGSIIKAMKKRGKLGNSLKWVFKDGLLTIRGAGAMPDRYFFLDAPWHSVEEGITSVVIDNGVTEIGRYAFFDCVNLTSVTVPDSITKIGSNAFCGCASLTSINVDEANEKYSSVDGVLFNKDMTTLVCCPGGKEGVYTIPDSVTTISDSAFEGCESLTKVVIPDSVTEIGDHAFVGCKSLTSVTIPDNVKSIGDLAFIFCESLTGVTVGHSVTTIGNNAFYDCKSLTSVTIPDSVTEIGVEAFSGCNNELILNVGKNSYAKEYAESHNIKYII